MWEHISRRKHILVKIFWTKMLQLGEKVLEMPLLSILSCSLCPVNAITRMLKLVPSRPNMPLFANLDGSPITYPVYMKFLKNKIHEIGLDVTNFSTHSFCRGAVSWAIKCGIPGSLIQVMGDWKSECYKMYINCPLDVRCQFVENSYLICKFYFTGNSIAIITDTFSHNILIKNCTLISLIGTQMHRFLEALEDKEVDLGRYNPFILVSGYNNLKLDRLFFYLYYNALQRQSPFTKFLISTLVTDIALFTSAIHSKNVVIKSIQELSDQIFLFDVWKKFQVLNMIQPEFMH